MYGFDAVPLLEVGPVITTFAPALFASDTELLSSVEFAITTCVTTPRIAARTTARTMPVRGRVANSSPSTSSVVLAA